MTKPVATIVLNRNLPAVTDALCENINRHNGTLTDVYVVEAGSDDDKLSSSTTWHADWDEARQSGLRYSRGMNYGLWQLWKEGVFAEYDFFFLLTNDTEFAPEPVIEPLMNIVDSHPRVGILSPCSKYWGERFMLTKQHTKYFWFIHNTAYLLRRQFIEAVMETEKPEYMNFLYDGHNFRGYGAEHEIIAKAYANDWAAAITADVWAEENESHLLHKADLIKTEGFEENRRLYVEEGKAWMRRKYGFNSRWMMQMYVKFAYDQFFEFHPESMSYKL